MTRNACFRNLTDEKGMNLILEVGSFLNLLNSPVESVKKVVFSSSYLTNLCFKVRAC